MPHAGPTPRRSRRARLSRHLESLFDSSRLDLASHVRNGLRIFVLTFPQIVNDLNFGSAYSSSWPLISVCQTRYYAWTCTQLRTRDLPPKARRGRARAVIINAQVTTMHPSLARELRTTDRGYTRRNRPEGNSPALPAPAPRASDAFPRLGQYESGHCCKCGLRGLD
jgi:hypothetical protein